MSRILLVFNTLEEMKPLRRAFDAAEMDVEVDTFIKSATKRLLQAPFTYLVCGLNLAEDGDSPVLPDGGLQLCAKVRHSSGVPIALIVPHFTNELQRRAWAVRPPFPTLLADEAGLGEVLVEQIRSVRERPSRIDIVIRAAERDNWSYDMYGYRVDHRRSGTFATNQQLVDAQRQLSGKILGTSEDWYESFSDLGKLIAGDLLANSDFKRDLSEAIVKVTSIHNTRLVFSVARKNYQIALEAILKPDLVDPWMVHAPLVRNILQDTVPAENSNLFEGMAHPLRCLVICADTMGPVNTVTAENRRATMLPKLKAIGTEARKIREMLRADPAVECATPLGFDEDTDPVTPDRLKTVLRDGNWDLVHYAGHSKFNYKDGREQGGYLFVGEKEKPQPIEIGEVAPFLRNCKLLYLSSCESANSTFAVELANNKIPAVIGFRWGIVDADAERHARLFYKALFEKQSIDTAFWSVRKAIHDADRRNNSWASSMLVMSR